jgi:hypothetical protein
MHEHPVEQQILGITGQKTSPERGQYAEVKARVVVLEAQCVLPVNARTHGISGLSIAQVLKKLQYRHQGHSPGCGTWLAAT